MSYLLKEGIRDLLKRVNRAVGGEIDNKVIERMVEALQGPVKILANSETYHSNLRKEFYHSEVTRTRDKREIIIRQTVVRLEGEEFIMEWSGPGPDPTLIFPNKSWICLIQDPELSVWLYKQSDKGPTQSVFQNWLLDNGYNLIPDPEEEQYLDPEDIRMLSEFWSATITGDRIGNLHKDTIIKNFLISWA